MLGLMHIISLVAPTGTVPSKTVVVLLLNGCPANPRLVSAVPPEVSH